jgi:hypothetical protein
VAGRAKSDPVEWWHSFRGEAEGTVEDEPPLFAEPEVEPKYWRRASFDLATHPMHPAPRVSQRDLLVPLNRDRMRLFLACLVCGAGLSVLWVYFPMMIVAIMLDNDFGPWKWVGMGAFAALMTVALFFYASAEEEKYVESIQ